MVLQYAFELKILQSVMRNLYCIYTFPLVQLKSKKELLGETFKKSRGIVLKTISILVIAVVIFGLTLAKSRNPKLAGVLAALATVMAFVGPYIVEYFGSANSNRITSEIVENLNAGNYSEAVQLYNSKVSGHNKKEETVNPTISDCITEIAVDYESATLLYEDAFEDLEIFLDIDNQGLSELANEKLSEIKKERDSQLAFEGGQQFILDEDYLDAIGKFLEVSDTSKWYDDAQKKIEECVICLVNNVAHPQNSDDYMTYIDLMRQALDILPDNTTLTQRYTELCNEYNLLVRQTAIEQAEQYIANDNYVEAFATIKAALKQLPDDSELTEQLQKYQTDYEMLITEQVAALCEAENYVDALNMVNQSLDVLNSDALQQSRNNVQANYEEIITKQANELADAGSYDEALNLVSQALTILNSTILQQLRSDIQVAQEAAIVAAAAAATEYSGRGVDFIIYNDSIADSEDSNQYLLTAPISGIYYLGLSEMVNGFKVKLYIYSADGTKIGGDSGLGNGSGVKCELNQGNMYTVEVLSYSNTGDYTLTIGQQKGTVDITAYNIICDEIEYIDQNIIYEFTPEINGIYRFDFSGVVNGFKLKLSVYDSLGYKVGGEAGLENNSGLTVELTAGETYSIHISQYIGSGSYTLSIGKQQPKQDVTGRNSISGSITYVDQQNIYTYVPSSNGEYSMSVHDMVSEFKIKLYVYDPLGYKIAGDSGLRDDGSITAELEAGNTYQIVVSQYSKNGDYTLRISR